MIYHLYTSEGTTIRYENNSAVNRHVEGRVTAGQPVKSTETLAVIEDYAKQYLFEHSDATVFIVEDDRVLRSLRNAEVDSWKDRYSMSVCVLWVHLALLAIYLIASTFHHYGLVGLLLAVAIVVLYQTIWRLGILNEIESGVLCAIILILSLILIPAAGKNRHLHGNTHTLATPIYRGDGAAGHA